MIQTREERQARFLRLFQDVMSELAEGNADTLTILKTGTEEELGALATKYELSQDELVFACDALLALRTNVENLTSSLSVLRLYK